MRVVAGVRARGPQHQPASATVNRQLPATHRLGAQRLIALYFPFVAVPRRHRRRASCSAPAACSSPTGVVTTGVRDRLPALPRPVLLADPAAVAGVRHVAAGARRRSSKIDELLDTPTGHARAAPTRSCPAALARRGRASTTCTSATRHRRRRGARAASTCTSRRARRSRSSARPARQVDGREARRPLLRPDRRARCWSTASTCATLDLGAFRHQLGVVPQEAFLFSGTIRDNIAYGRPDATDAEVEAAARAVGAHDFIAVAARRLPRSR